MGSDITPTMPTSPAPWAPPRRRQIRYSATPAAASDPQVRKLNAVT